MSIYRSFALEGIQEIEFRRNNLTMNQDGMNQGHQPPVTMRSKVSFQGEGECIDGVENVKILGRFAILTKAARFQ